jgi:hypothetical protein
VQLLLREFVFGDVDGDFLEFFCEFERHPSSLTNMMTTPRASTSAFPARLHQPITTIGFLLNHLSPLLRSSNLR